MSLPHSASEESKAFGRLDPRIQRWIWDKGWTSLREAQERAVAPLLAREGDLIIASATASGKTEAALLPMLTDFAAVQEEAIVLCISPLKALINDQWDRLLELCGTMEIPVIPWHGDASQSKKQAFLKRPHGVVLITPESLESWFVNRGTFVERIADRVRYIMVDELHAFIGTERGKQMQSLIARMELLASAPITRVGLSATLGDMPMAAGFLRPDKPSRVQIISAAGGGQALKLLVKAVLCDLKPPKQAQEPEDELALSGGVIQIAADVFRATRGSNNMVFPGTRQNVERYTAMLAAHCEKVGVPNEYWAHHGSLSKAVREETEAALKDGSKPATVVCTATLELGIDIGAIKSVVQIGAPASVAVMRQRLGRSGRREGEAAILRAYVSELTADKAEAIADRLRCNLVQTIAVIDLLMERWYEPPRAKGFHGTTLVQQVLSVIAQYGGASAAQIFMVLGRKGAFSQLTPEDLQLLLRELAHHSLITQDATGLLLLGPRGEQEVNHYEFYAVFASTDDFRVVADGRDIGAMPPSGVAAVGYGIILGGRRWRITEIDEERKTIYVKPDKGGAPPSFAGSGSGPQVHDRVRARMYEVLRDARPFSYLDPAASSLLAEARQAFHRAHLAEARYVEDGTTTLIMLWRGDAVNATICMLFLAEGIMATAEEVAIRVHAALATVVDILQKWASAGEALTLDLSGVKDLANEKWDWALPRPLLEKSYASSKLDLSGAVAAIGQLVPRG